MSPRTNEAAKESAAQQSDAQASASMQQAQSQLAQETGQMQLEHAGCLECGSCLVICPLGAVSWNLPPPGFGVHYRYG